MRLRISKTLFTAVLMLSAVLFTFQLFKSLSFMFTNLAHYKWFFLGGLVYILSIKTILKRNIGFFLTWTHEAMHTFMCVVCFHKIEKFEASARNGGVVYHYGGRNILISLAPYTLPLFTFILLTIWMMIPLRFVGYQVLIGFSFFLHLHAIVTQLSPDQPDLTDLGLPISFAYIFTVLPMNLAICLYAIDMKLWHAAEFFFKDSWLIINSVLGFIF